MYSNQAVETRRAPALARSVVAFVGFVIMGSFTAGAAHGQELIHRFINPSFGGNPFYSDHLLSTANIHRPEEPEDPAAPPPTEEDLLASQLRARFLSQLSTQIQQRIQTAKPGESGNFEFGNQRVAFTRTANETRVTFTNITNGESSVVILPVAGATGTTSAATASAEQALLGSN